MVNKCDVIKTLQEGKKHVEAGWCQGALFRGNRVCALGGVEKFGRDNVEYYGSISPARFFLETAVDKQYGGVADYNDSTGRKKEDILGLYDKALKLACKEMSDAETV